MYKIYFHDIIILDFEQNFCKHIIIIYLEIYTRFIHSYNYNQLRLS